MRPVDLLWFFIPDQALPLLIVGLGLVTIVGLIRPRRAVQLIILLACLPLISAATEAVLAMLPWWVTALSVVLLFTNTVRVVLEVFWGREAAGHILGHAVTAAIRGLFRVVKAAVFGLASVLHAGGSALIALIRRHRNAVAVVALAFAAGAGPLHAQVGRGILRGAERSAERGFARALGRDVERDAATAARHLARPRTVFRFTTPERARAELRSGIPAGAHMTSKAGPGRPLSGLTAQRKYGLPQRPSVRETIRIPAGTPVRANKALMGGRGVGELTSTKRIPGSVERVVSLPRGRGPGNPH